MCNAFSLFVLDGPNVLSHTLYFSPAFAHFLNTFSSFSDRMCVCLCLYHNNFRSHFFSTLYRSSNLCTCAFCFLCLFHSSFLEIQTHAHTNSSFEKINVTHHEFFVSIMRIAICTECCFMVFVNAIFSLLLCLNIFFHSFYLRDTCTILKI